MPLEKNSYGTPSAYVDWEQTPQGAIAWWRREKPSSWFKNIIGTLLFVVFFPGCSLVLIGIGSGSSTTKVMSH
ncbi:MAG: hypothetical protein HY537_07105 [Deltaproteobacteria bacterium]|nr:hypothetical protein [Deltaproteobacteria bacterium]